MGHILQIFIRTVSNLFWITMKEYDNFYKYSLYFHIMQWFLQGQIWAIFLNLICIQSEYLQQAGHKCFLGQYTKKDPSERSFGLHWGQGVWDTWEKYFSEGVSLFPCFMNDLLKLENFYGILLPVTVIKKSHTITLIIVILERKGPIYLHYKE